MKNKFLTISIILILLSSIFFTSNVFATETLDLTCCFDVIPIHENGDQYVPYFIYQKADGTIYLITTHSTSAINLFIKSGDYVYADVGGINRYKYDSNNNCFVAEYTGKSSGTIGIDIGSVTFLASNIDIYRNDSLFFQQNPVSLPHQDLTLARVLEETNPVEMWKTLMKNVVVSLAVFLVGLIAFLKAWTWLKTQLRKA